MPHFIYLFHQVMRHYCCLYFLATMNNTGINIYLKVFMWTYVFISLVYIPRNGIAGSCGNSMFTRLRNCQPIFPRGCAILRSLQQCMRVMASPHLLRHLLLSFNSHSRRCEVVSHVVLFNASKSFIVDECL